MPQTFDIAMKKTANRKILAVLKAAWLYSFLLWLYIAVENLVYPSMVYSTDFSYYVPVKTNLLGIISFALSFVFYFLLKLYG